MSDFFTRLAERTLGLAPTIQPMMPSLFAPEPDLPGDMLFEFTEESEESFADDKFSGNVKSAVPAQDATMHPTYPNYPTARPLQHEASQPFLATSSAAALRQQPALTTMTERQSTWQPDSLTTPRETLATGVRVQPMPRGTQRTRPITSALPAISAISAISAPSTYMHTPSFAPVNAQTLSMARQNGEITEPTATFLTSSVIDDPFTHSTHVSTVSATSEQQMVEAQQTTQAALPHEQTISHHTLLGIPASNPLSTTGFPQIQQAQQTQAAQLETLAPEPAIQVTIGRVEVRAVTAPPTSARSQQQSVRPPAMSLDEYLRQQERGGRR